MAEPRSSRARFGAMVVVALLACAVGGAFVFSMRGSRAPTAGGMVTAPSASGVPAVSPRLPSSIATTAVAAPDPPKVTDVEITIDAMPKDAKVMDGARELGTAPGPFTLKAGAPVTLTVAGEGLQESRCHPHADHADHRAGDPGESRPRQRVVKGGAGKGKPISSDLESFDTNNK